MGRSCQSICLHVKPTQMISMKTCIVGLHQKLLGECKFGPYDFT